jgi:hypothetical protein
LWPFPPLVRECKGYLNYMLFEFQSNEGFKKFWAKKTPPQVEGAVFGLIA